MLKRLLLYFIGFVVLASLAYYGFSRWQANREKVDLWALVPESAALVIETSDHQQLVDHLDETGLWQNLEGLPIMQQLQENLALLDSVSPGKQRLNRFFDKKNILTSLHVTDTSTLNFVFYIPVTSVGEHRFLRTLTENISRHPDFEQETRTFENLQLITITYLPLELSYTYFSYHNNLILSASQELIEAVARRTTQENLVSVAADYKNANYLQQPDVFANVYLNNRVFPDVLNLFLKDDVMPQVRYLSSLSQNGMLQLKLDENKIFLNGFSNAETQPGSLHRKMGAVKPKPILVKDYLPLRTAVMFHFGVQQLTRLKQTPKPTTANPTIDSLAATFNRELILTYLESNSTNTSPEKVIYALSGNKARTMQLLNKLQAGQKRGYTGTYGGYKIQQVMVPELPASMFGEMFSGFAKVYAVELDKYILFTDELTTAQGLIDDVLEEKVWSKSAAQQAFLKETLHEANFSFFINTVNAWYVLSRYTSENERESMLQAASFIKRFNQVAVQYARVEEQYYTSILIRKQEGNHNAQSAYNVIYSIPFDSPIISRPFAVRDVVGKSGEVVVQDSVHTLTSIASEGKKNWVDTLRTAVRGGIKQLPLGPEGRLRYLFTSSSRIHAIDNEGQSLENFPFNLTDTLNIEYFTTIDYDKGGNYNLLVSDNLGHLYMYDIRGGAVPGWQPRRLDYKLAAEPKHLRIGTRDVILSLLENGYVYALNKTGDTYRGFPFSLRSPVTSGAMVTTTGPDLRRTELKTITRYGEVITFNLEGRVLRRQQLPRPTKSAMFELVPEESSNRNFILVRQDQGKVAVFNQKQQLQFEKRYVTSAPKKVQYYNFGGDNVLYAITETGPQKTYLYDKSGKLIGGKALDSNQPVTIYFNDTDNTFTLFKVYRKELQKISFRMNR